MKSQNLGISSMFRTKNCLVINTGVPQNNESGLSFFNVFFLGISCVIGTGIYSAPVSSFAAAGTASIVSLFICGILCISIALPFAELSTRIEGFSYEYIYTTCGEFLALFYTLGIICVNVFVTAIASQLWSSFFVQLLGLNIDSKYVEFLPILGITIMVLLGRRSSAIVSNISTIINLLNAVLGGIMLWTQKGFEFPAQKLASGFTDIDKAKLCFPIWFFTFLGFENVGAIARNAKNASRTIPVSMIVPLLIAIGLNLFILIGVMGQNIDVNKSSILEIIQWREIRGIMQLGALFGVTSAMLWICILQGIMIETISKDGLIPQFLNTKSENGTPYLATILHMIFAIVCCYCGSITGLITTLGWSIIGMPMSCLGLIFIHYSNNKENPTQQNTLKKFGFIFALIFIVLGSLDAFPNLGIFNTWTFRGSVALFVFSFYCYLCNKSKITCEISPVPCIGFPYIPLFGAMSFFFIVGYTMHFGSFFTMLIVTGIIYYGYSSNHSKLNEKPEYKKVKENIE